MLTRKFVRNGYEKKSGLFVALLKYLLEAKQNSKIIG